MPHISDAESTSHGKLHFLSGVFIMTSVIVTWSACEPEPLRSMCVPARVLSRIVLSLTKQNDKIQPTKNDNIKISFRNYITPVYMKDQVLGNVFEGTFSDSFRRILSPHPHCQGILQSTSSQICHFQPLSRVCLLILWLKVWVPNFEFSFSRNYG